MVSMMNNLMASLEAGYSILLCLQAAQPGDTKEDWLATKLVRKTGGGFRMCVQPLDDLLAESI